MSSVVSFTKQPKEFEYFALSSLEGASKILLAYGENAHILAGGTDVVPNMKRGHLSPKSIVNIKRIPNLSYMYIEDSILKIGALTTIEDIRKSSLIRDHYQALHMASEVMGTQNIRNVATIAGNVCRASPASDMISPLMALEADLKIFGPNGWRIIPLEDFLIGPEKTQLGIGEIVTEIRVTKQPTKQAFLKSKRVSHDLAKINICAVFDYAENRCSNIRITIGSAAPKVVRVKRTEEFLESKELRDEVIEEAGRIAQTEISPITDVRSTSDYRRKMGKVLLKRVIKTALERGVAL